MLAHPLRETEEGMHCKHGPEECKAAMMELCTQETHPDSRSLVGFLECLTHEYQRIPERAHYEACAAKNHIDLEKVDQCAARDGGEYALELLRKSAQRTIDVSETSLPRVLTSDDMLQNVFDILIKDTLTLRDRRACTSVVQSG